MIELDEDQKEYAADLGTCYGLVREALGKDLATPIVALVVFDMVDSLEDEEQRQELVSDLRVAAEVCRSTFGDAVDSDAFLEVFDQMFG